MHLDFKSLKSESLSSFLAESSEPQLVSRILWALKRAKAAFVVNNGVDETIWGADLGVTEESLLAAVDAQASVKEPYGHDANYADPGFRNGVKRYPCDNSTRTKAAWSYIHQKKNASKYTSEQLAHIKAHIIAAWKKLISKDGPPAAKEE